MSHFDKLLSKVSDISLEFSKNFQQEYQLCLTKLDEFEVKYAIELESKKKSTSRTTTTSTSAAQINNNVNETNNCLQSIHEDEESSERASLASTTSSKSTSSSKHASKALVSNDIQSSATSQNTDERLDGDFKRRKRSKEEMQDAPSPEQEKRQKRNASTRALANINKQVNVNLSQKLRRPEPEETQTAAQDRRRRGRNTDKIEDNKENMEENILPVAKVKLEKLSLTAEGQIQQQVTLPVDIKVKQEKQDDFIVPTIPAPKARKNVANTTESTTEETGSRRSTRSRKNTATEIQNTAASTRPRRSARTTRASEMEQQNSVEQDTAAEPPTRSKRTRARKNKQPDIAEEEVDDKKPIVANIEKHNPEQETETEPEAVVEKARPKRTRRAAKKSLPKVVEQQPIEPKPEVQEDVKRAPTEPVPESKLVPEPVPVPESNAFVPTSPILAPAKKMKIQSSSSQQDSTTTQTIETQKQVEETPKRKSSVRLQKHQEPDQDSQCSADDEEFVDAENNDTELTRIIERHSITNAVSKVLMNETVVLDKGGVCVGGEEHDRGTFVVAKQTSNTAITPLNGITKPIFNQTVTINHQVEISNDDSLISEDNSEIQNTPPHLIQANIKPVTPKSAVKEKVQQFEELAAGGGRVTRTKTRAMNKQMEEAKVLSIPAKSVLSSATLMRIRDMQNGLNKLNPLSSASQSAVKPRPNIITAVKSFLPQSASKAQQQLAAANSRADELKQKTAEKEDAIRKKEAMLEAKREEQRRRREAKMLAAAEARELAAKQREAALHASAQEKIQRANIVLHKEKIEKLKEAEKKRLALEKKMLETEERRKAEEAARLARLEEEQRRAEAFRRKQLEQEKLKREALNMDREMQALTQQYHAKEKERKMKQQLLKHRLETDKMHTSMTAPGTPSNKMAPMHMADGFQYLNSDSEEEDEKKPKRTPPSWCRRSERYAQLDIQRHVAIHHIDKLFSVRKHSPDLMEMFPAIDKRKLKRTSSAVWRTPPRLTALLE